MSPQRVRAKAVAALLAAHRSPGGIFGQRLPESRPPRGVDVGSKEHVLYLTFTVALDFQRDAAKLWDGTRQAYEDPATRYLFHPASVLEKSADDLRRDLRAHGVPLRFPNRDIRTWARLARTFVEHYGGDPRVFIRRECRGDAFAAHEILRADSTRFPSLRGRKIAPLWLRILHDEAAVELKNLHRLPIPVDVHITRATTMLGLVEPGSPPDEVRNAWSELLGSDTGIYPLQLDQPLWLLSRYGCSTADLERRTCAAMAGCPVSGYCRLNASTPR